MRMTADAATRVPSASTWRTSPSGWARLLVGLWIFGAGDALLVRSGLGNSPWTVFAEGLSLQTSLSIGMATIAISLVLLLIWIPLRVRLGIGTICNVIVIGVAIDATLALVTTPELLALQVTMLLAGVALIGVGSGLYLGVALGPGPRDGLMTGLHRLTGRPIGLVRAGIELSALAVGWALGGTLGVGTVAFALLIGPSVQTGIALDQRLRAARALPVEAPRVDPA